MAESPAQRHVQGTRFDRRVDLREAIAMMGVIVAIMALWLPLAEYFEGRPRLLLRVETATLRSDLTPASVLERLEQIQNRFAGVTLSWIQPGLMDSALELDDRESGYEKALERFAERMSQAVEYFDSETAQWQVHEIVYENEVVTWPDGYSLNLIQDQYRSLEFLALVGELDQEDAEAIKNVATEFYPDRQSENVLLRKRAGKELKDLEDEIYQAAAGKGRRLVVSVTVDNGSRLPNSVRRRNRVSLEDDSRQLMDGDLDVLLQDGNGRLDGYSGRTLTFRSEALNISQAAAMEQGGRFTLRVEDVKDKTWVVKGGIEANSREGTGDRFIASAGRSR